MDELVVGVDLGGTKIEAIVARRGGPQVLEVLHRRRTPSEQERGYEAIVARTAAFIAETAREAQLDLAAVPIGIGMPGGVTRRGGLVKN
jgi:fructokinase